MAFLLVQKSVRSNRLLIAEKRKPPTVRMPLVGPRVDFLLFQTLYLLCYYAILSSKGTSFEYEGVNKPPGSIDDVSSFVDFCILYYRIVFEVNLSTASQLEARPTDKRLTSFFTNKIS